MNYVKPIEAYEPKNEQEHVDKEAIIAFIKHNGNALLRENQVAHLTSSAIVVNETMDKVLFAYHKLYDAWSWVGGHNDGDPDLLHVAIKETKEETGVNHVRPYSDDIFMVDIIHVTNHYKHGKYVSDHLHLNVTYLLIADEDDQLIPQKDENLDVRWFRIDDVLNHVHEARMIPVYQKAFKAIKAIKDRNKGEAK